VASAAQAITGLQLFDGWTDPRALPAPVNTVGWEEASQISASGTRLYFSYTPADFTALVAGVPVLVGPRRPGENRDGLQLFEATFDAGPWVVNVSSASYPGANPESFAGLDDAETTMALVRYDGTPNEGDLYLTKLSGGEWAPSTKVPAPVSTPCVEDNPSLSADGQRLYFDSNRADPTGTTCKTIDGGSTVGVEYRDLWVSTLSGGVWGVPVLVAGDPAQGTVHWQPYARNDATELYWVGNDAMCGGGTCVYRATRQGDGSWGGKLVVAKTTPYETALPGQAWNVGHVSFTRDGRYMYFSFMAKTDLDGGFDGGPTVNPDIGVARHP
jgi:hypothetical protein